MTNLDQSSTTTTTTTTTANVPSKQRGNGSHISRDALRASIFASENTQLKRKLVKFFGMDIELRQSTWGEIVSSRPAGVQSAEELTDDDQKFIAVRGLIRAAYVPGTDERVFEEADADQLLAMPFGGELSSVFEALNELAGANPTQKKSG